MAKRLYNLLLAFIGLAFTITGCLDDAPRDNVLDPNSNRFTGEGRSRIEGVVRAYGQNTTPIQDAQVLLVPGGYFARSSAAGRFSFSNLQPGNYTLHCQKNGYRQDSLSFTLGNQPATIEFKLNAFPQFNSISIQSHHISRWWPNEDSFYLSILTQVFDPDGINEVDSVWIEIPSIAYAETLSTTGFLGLYQQTIQENQMPLQSLRELEGKPITFYAHDTLGNITQSDNRFIPRIVEEVPVIQMPSSFAVVDSFPANFSWQPVFLDFDFNYKIEIFQINLGFYALVRSYQDIAGGASNFMINEPLAAGEYFWILYIVDEFGDTSSSKEGAFSIP